MNIIGNWLCFISFSFVSTECCCIWGRSADFLRYTELVHLLCSCDSHGFSALSLVYLILWNYIWEMRSFTQKLLF